MKIAMKTASIGMFPSPGKTWMLAMELSALRGMRLSKKVLAALLAVSPSVAAFSEQPLDLAGEEP